MSWGEVSERVDEDAHAEWVDSEVVETGATTQRHQENALFLLTFMGRYVEYRECGEVFGWGSNMKLECSDRMPDLIFVAGEHRDRVTSSYFDGPADLVVEIIRLPILPDRQIQFPVLQEVDRQRLQLRREGAGSADCYANGWMV